MASSWERLASVTLSSTGSTLSSGTFTAKEHLRVTFITIPSGAANPRVRLNNDSGNNYARRRSEDYGSENTVTSDDDVDYGRGTGDVVHGSLDIINIATKEKLVESHSSVSNGDGAGNAPKSGEIVWKWVNTSDQVTRIDVINSQSGDFAVGSTITVWGADDQASTPVYPKLQDGSIYEEQDTGKIYIWNLSTNTWSEI